MARDPAKVGRRHLAQASDQLTELRRALAVQAVEIPEAEFDPVTGAPCNEAGLWSSNLSLVADELGELIATIGRIEGFTDSAGSASSESPSDDENLTVSHRQLRPRPLIWDVRPGTESSNLEDPAGHWHARIWKKDGIWFWELAPGYSYGRARRIPQELESGEWMASVSCTQALELHGWPVACLPAPACPRPGNSEPVARAGLE